MEFIKNDLLSDWHMLVPVLIGMVAILVVVGIVVGFVKLFKFVWEVIDALL